MLQFLDKFWRERPNKFTALFYSIIALFAVSPFVPAGVIREVAIGATLTVILIATIYAVSNKQINIFIALCLALPSMATALVYYLTSDHNVLISSYILRLAFFIYTTAISVTYVMRDEDVGEDTIYGSICVYFLIGMTWAHIFALLELVQHGSFSGDLLYVALEDKYTSNFISSFFYYSFVTLTTLGYGDMTPVSLPAKTFAILEAVFGQLYLTILVARLIGLHIRRK